MSERTINAGDWLEHKHYGRVRVAGFDEDGDPVFTHEDGNEVECDLMRCFLASTRPLPGCDSWEWVESESESDPSAKRVMAAWMRLQGMREDEIATYKHETIEIELQNLEATVRMQEPIEALSTCPDCGEFRGHGHEDVCQMAWVEITDPEHVFRVGVDQFSCPPTTWTTMRIGHVPGTLGEYKESCGDEIGRCRCRRKDIPVPMTLQSVAEVRESTPDPASPFGDAMRQPANRVPVLLWIPANRLPEGFGDLLWSTGEVSEDDIRGLVEVKHDSNGFFLEREP